MATVQDRILIVESDPLISDLIGRQTLQAAGYQVFVVGDANAAIAKAVQLVPDVILANLHLSGLTGKDLLVALNSQNIETPVIMIAPKGAESDVIQTFRLGAADYILWPAREPEIIQVVERTIKQVRERRERERLSKQLQQTNQELQNRVRELTTIFSIGKAVISVTDQSVLFEKILDGAVKVSQADMGWFLMRDEASKLFLLAAQRNLPPTVSARVGQPFDDGVSSLVAMSGELLTLHGDPIRRFKIAALGQSTLIVPVRVQKQVIGLLVLVRRQPVPFNGSEQNLMEAMADYASISLVNSQLFRTVEQRARSSQMLADSAQTREKIMNEVLSSVKRELNPPITSARDALDRITKDPTLRWNPTQRQTLTDLQDALVTLSRTSEAILPLPVGQFQQGGMRVNLNDLIREAVNRYLPFAQHNNVTLVAGLPLDPVMVQGDAALLTQALHGLLSNGIKYCHPGGQVAIRLEVSREGQAHIAVTDAGSGMDPAHTARVFEPRPQVEAPGPRRFGGLGVGLPLVKTIVTQQNGSVWAESKLGQGSTFHVLLPIIK
ncbi:MAG TPA: hybrid sensor histidine kinase/response regulator [Anaerolineaceae bacterium]|nr:hybrid sensor histidine kinase/response regulator [Anaerolineaceae bacterium]